MRVDRLPVVVFAGTFSIGVALTFLPPQSTRLVDLGVGVLTGSVVGLFIWSMERSEAERIRQLNESLAERDRRLEQDRQAARDEDQRRADEANRRLAVQAMVIGKDVIHGLNLSDQDLRGLVFAHKRLAFVDFEGSNLADCDFSGSTLRNVSFRDGSMDGARFLGCVLEEVDFSGASLEGCLFSGARAEGVKVDAASGLSDEAARELGLPGADSGSQ